MKIFILKVPQELQPKSQPFKYPAHNKDYGVEQDFLIWLKKNPDLLTKNPQEADWHYLPIYWTRWHLNHNFGAHDEGLSELTDLTDKCILDDSKTFLTCMFDDGPLVNTGKTIKFLASRKSIRASSEGIDIPLLCSAHAIPPLKLSKKYLGSFNGSYETHPIRGEMLTALSFNKEIHLGGTQPRSFLIRQLFGPFFIENILRSYTALAPRGYGGTSFRFYESMQLAVAPILISDYDARPFKKFIPWDDISYYIENIPDLENLLNNLNKSEALEKGRRAYDFFKNELFYQKWCKYILKELEIIN